MENKQTAVEWLVDELLDGKLLMPSLIEQAKEMEKQQTVKFTEEFIEMFTFGTYDGEVYQSKEISDYYNETYGSKGSENKQ